ncbi:MAG: hypothetical protein WBA31_07130 [Candidatus Dormiibacterota bacterium]
MSLPSIKRKLRAACRVLSMTALVFVVVVGMCGALTESVLAAGTLTKVTWSVSNNAGAATGVNYSYSFTTATAGTIGLVTFTVSGGTLAGTPNIVAAYGIGAGTVARSGNTITYTVTTPAAVAAGIPILLEFGGNTNMAAGSYTTAITTKTSAAVAIDGPTNTPSVTFAATSTAETIVVTQSLTFTLNNTAFTLTMDPSLASLADQTNTSTLTVLTNANSGYTVTVADSANGLSSSSAGNPTIPGVAASGTFVSWPGAPVNATGYTVSGTATIPAGFSSGIDYTGFSNTPLQIASSSGPTGTTAQTIILSNQVAIDYATATGTYTDIITYTVTPNYS